MPIRATHLSTDFTSSTRLSIENIRLMPSTGFILSIFGVIFFVENTGPTCRNSITTPSASTMASSGRHTHSRVSKASWPRRGRDWSKGWPMACRLCSNNPATRP